MWVLVQGLRSTQKQPKIGLEPITKLLNDGIDHQYIDFECDEISFVNGGVPPEMLLVLKDEYLPRDSKYKIRLKSDTLCGYNQLNYLRDGVYITKWSDGGYFYTVKIKDFPASEEDKQQNWVRDEYKGGKKTQLNSPHALAVRIDILKNLKKEDMERATQRIQQLLTEKYGENYEELIKEGKIEKLNRAEHW